MKTLVIAEKPSVATDLAKVLGVKKSGDWYEDDNHIISSAVGHVVELQMPEDIDKKLSFWTLETLPIIPAKFGLKPSEDAKDRFQLLDKLMSRKDVGTVINACDAGREGELIFTYLYELAECKKPVKRLWMQSMTKTAIQSAFKNLRDGVEFKPLQDAARSRSEADWLIGINGTRAATKRLFGRAGAGNVASLGRVQTPTLSLVYEREKLIRAFVPRTYWRLAAEFQVSEGTYFGIAQKPGFKKGADEHDKADRYWAKPEAERLLAGLAKSPIGFPVDEKKRQRQNAPRLYDLTTLQREANGRFGLSASSTLKIAQALYEKHKVLTYPRTDSRALPEDYPDTVRKTLGQIEGGLGVHAKRVLNNNWVKPGDKSVFNNSQISDHFAIIPTGETADLKDLEAKIYDMVVKRFIAVFHPAAEFDVTTRTTTVGEVPFLTTGKVLVVPGWLEVYGKGEADTEEKNKDQAVQLPALTAADGNPAKARVIGSELEEDATRPPPRYTEATLLSAMETAGKLVEDEEHAAAMKDSGLGTPATRASIIDNLVNTKYMERGGKELIPTAKAGTIMEFLVATKVEVLTSPALTGQWEKQLKDMEAGHFTRENFIKGISDLTRTIVENIKGFTENSADSRETTILSPTDGLPMRESLRTYVSQDGLVKIYRTIGQRNLTEEELGILLKDKAIGPLEGFRSKMGRPYKAKLVLGEDWKISFEFAPRLDANGEVDVAANEPVDYAKCEVVGTCPASGLAIYDTPRGYRANPEDVASAKAKNVFSLGKTMLGLPIPREQIVKLLSEKKTDLLQGFMSNRTKRKFDAFLLVKPNAGIGFDFPPREPKAKKEKGADGEAAPKKASKKAARKSTAKKAVKAVGPVADEPF